MRTKLISMLLALCMVFSVMSSNVFAEGGLITYAEGVVTVDTGDTSVNKGVLIAATHAEDNTIKSIEKTELNFTDGKATVEKNVDGGTTLMVWNSVQQMIPLLNSYFKPRDEVWTTNDAELNKIVYAAGDKAAFGPYNGLRGYGNWTNKTGQGTAKYTHTDGKAYTFTNNWNAGSGGTARRAFIFTPKQSCIVTVPYKAQAGRPLFIYQGNNLLASGEEGLDKSGNAATLVADIDDPTAGDVIIYGGSSDKQIFGIFADYYDPNVIVYRKVSGNINYAGSGDTSKAKIIFTDTKDATRYEVALKAGAYSTELRQNRNYKISIEEDGKVSEKLATTLDTNSLSLAKMDKTFNIDVVDIALTKVTGDVVVHDIYNDGTTVDLSKVKLTFKAKDDPAYTYETSIKNNKIDVEMMPNHEYEVTATDGAIDILKDYTMSKLSGSYLMAAGDTAPFKNILFTENAKPIAFKSEVKVGADKEYKKVGDAITAIKAMTGRPVGEKGRVSVLIDPGTYVEQVIVDSPYITLKAADPSNRHRPTITFYYGIGYLYYSADGGYYSEDRAVQKTAVNTVTRWGSVCRVTGQNFIAEDIIFENSFSCRITPEEIADNVTSAPAGWYGDVSGKPDRTVEGYDPKTKNAVERAAAFAGDGNNWELYNCDFISSQDTFYTGYNGYVKNCYIEGGTDYIFGGNSVLFEDCTLAWHGYSDQETGGYITACKSSDKPVAGIPNLNANGYLFKNCTVANSKYYPNNKFAAGDWGRNWGGANCQVVLQGITIADGAKVPGTWTKMGGELKDSIIFVDDVKKADGTKIDVSSTKFNPNGTMASKNYTPMKPTDYFGNWIPKHYDGEIPAITEINTTWNFGKGNGAPSYAIETDKVTGISQSLEIVGNSNTPEDVILKVDTGANGKFNNANRTDEWCQVNVGTKFIVPVKKGSVITFNVYDKAGKLKIGDEEIDPTQPYTVKTDVTSVTIEAIATTDVSKGVQYIASITVKTPLGGDEPGVETTTASENTTGGGSEDTTSSNEPTTESTVNLAADFTWIGSKEILTAEEIANKSEVSFGLTAEGNRVGVDDASAAWTFTGFKYHSDEHGLNPGTITVKVPGSVKIKYGTCAWGSDVTVKNGETTVTTKNSNNGTCYHNDRDNNVIVMYYKGDATTLTISGGGYTPYVAVESVNEADIPKNYTVTFDKGSEEGLEGDAPAKIEVEAESPFTIPLNKTLYVEGKTLTGWQWTKDGETTPTVYKPGDTVSDVSKDITLTPVFTANPQSLVSTAEVSVVFDFQRKNGAPTLAYGDNSTGIYVSQATVGENKIDVKMNTSGKVANANWTDWVQLGKSLTVPVVNGSVVSIDDAYNKTNDWGTINGTTVNNAGKSVTINDATAKTAEIVIGGGTYYRTFTVTYPSGTNFVDVKIPASTTPTE